MCSISKRVYISAGMHYRRIDDGMASCSIRSRTNVRFRCLEAYGPLAMINPFVMNNTLLYA